MNSRQTWAPSWGGLALVAATFLAGVVLASVLTLILTKNGVAQDVCLTVSYPVMFLVTAVLVLLKSRRPGVVKSRVDVDARKVSWWLYPLVVLLVFAASFVIEVKPAMEAAVGGNFWLNLLSVAILAPILEEWLCRGLVLRGLVRNGKSPVLAIVVSAAFFAIIHGNMWQAIPAFIIGVLFGYVYYSTGSLKLTILMHFTNNFLSLLMSRMDGIGEDDTWMSVMPQGCYWILFVMFAITLVLGVCAVRRFHVVHSQNVSSVF